MVVEPVDGGPDALAGRGAVWLAERIWAAVGARGVAHVALSGGSTPALMIRSLATLPMPWTALHVWQVDERVAPDHDPDRNADQLAPLAPASIHYLPVTASDLEAAAASYGRELRASCGGVLDVVHLGAGDDGHTASWPPGVAIREDLDVAIVGPFRGRVRLTLTPPIVNAARERVVLAEGTAKVAALAALMSTRTDLPIGLLQRDHLTVLADPVALAGLTRTVSLQ